MPSSYLFFFVVVVWKAFLLGVIFTRVRVCLLFICVFDLDVLNSVGLIAAEAHYNFLKSWAQNIDNLNCIIWSNKIIRRVLCATFWCVFVPFKSNHGDMVYNSLMCSSIIRSSIRYGPTGTHTHTKQKKH